MGWLLMQDACCQDIRLSVSAAANAAVAALVADFDGVIVLLLAWLVC